MSVSSLPFMTPTVSDIQVLTVVHVEMDIIY